MELERRIPFLVESRNDYTVGSLPPPGFPPLSLPPRLPHRVFSFPLIFLFGYAGFSPPLSLFLSSFCALKLPTRTEIFAESPALCAAIMLSTGLRLLGTVMRIF